MNELWGVIEGLGRFMFYKNFWLEDEISWKGLRLEGGWFVIRCGFDKNICWIWEGFEIW